MWRVIPVVAPLLTLVASASTSLLNITIDDQYADPQTGLSILYSPSTIWQNGQTCDNCTAQPDANKAYMQTWKLASYDPSEVEVSASITFTGVAVYVKCILTGSSESTNGTTDLNFYIDDENMGSYSEDSNTNSSYQYGVTVFAKEGLSSGLHTLTIESEKSSSSGLIMLDSITYSSEQINSLSSTSISSSATSSPSASSASSSSHIGIIVGATLGGLAALGIITGFVAFLWRRGDRNRRRRRGTSVLLDLADRGMPGRYSGSEARATPFILDRKASITTQDSRSSEESSDRTSFWTDVRTAADVGKGSKDKSKSKNRSKSEGLMSDSRDMGRSLRHDVVEDLKPPAYTYDGPSTFSPAVKS